MANICHQIYGPTPTSKGPQESKRLLLFRRLHWQSDGTGPGSGVGPGSGAGTGKMAVVVVVVMMMVVARVAVFTVLCALLGFIFYGLSRALYSGGF